MKSLPSSVARSVSWARIVCSISLQRLTSGACGPFSKRLLFRLVAEESVNSSLTMCCQQQTHYVFNAFCNEPLGSLHFPEINFLIAPRPPSLQLLSFPDTLLKKIDNHSSTSTEMVAASFISSCRLCLCSQTSWGITNSGS